MHCFPSKKQCIQEIFPTLQDRQSLGFRDFQGQLYWLQPLPHIYIWFIKVQKPLIKQKRANAEGTFPGFQPLGKALQVTEQSLCLLCRPICLSLVITRTSTRTVTRWSSSRCGCELSYPREGSMLRGLCGRLHMTGETSLCGEMGRRMIGQTISRRAHLRLLDSTEHST